MPTLKIYSGIFAATMAVVQGCQPAAKQSSRRQASALSTTPKVVTTTQTTGGATAGAISAAATAPQTIQAPAGSTVAGSSVTFPPGALAIDTTVKVEQAVALTTGATTAQLGLGGQIASSGTAVAVQSSVATTALQPFTVAIPLPPQTGLVADAYANLIVIYKTILPNGKAYTGLLLRSGLTLGGTTVAFATKNFGAYQAVLTKTLVQEAKEVETVAAPLAKAEVANLPALAVTGRTPFMVRAGDQVQIAGKNFRSTMTLALGPTRITNARVASDASLSFAAPAVAKPGLATLYLDQDGVSQTVSLIYLGAATDIAVSSKAVSEVCSGEKFYDLNGTLQVGTRNCSGAADCTVEGTVGCVTTSTLLPVDATTVAAKVVVGQSVAGVAGIYAVPASSNVLAGTSFGPPAAAVSGTLPSCATDGQTGCITGTVFKAANVTGISTWDLRAGQTLAGISGTLKTNCRNKVNSTYFNYDGAVSSLTTSGVTTGTTLDYWDTVDDYYGFSASTVSAWSANTNCDSTNWSDVTTTNGGSSFVACGTSSTCIYKDLITNLQVTGILATGGSTTNTGTPVSYTWPAAINACAGSTYGGYPAGAWRLPTQKELLSLYEHGITALTNANFLTLATMQNYVWTSSTYANGTSNAWAGTLAYAFTQFSAKTTSYPVVCVK